jgi:hypothetical protein
VLWRGQKIDRNKAMITPVTSHHHASVAAGCPDHSTLEACIFVAFNSTKAQAERYEHRRSAVKLVPGDYAYECDAFRSLAGFVQLLCQGVTSISIFSPLVRVYDAFRRRSCAHDVHLTISSCLRHILLVAQSQH